MEPQANWKIAFVAPPLAENTAHLWRIPLAVESGAVTDARALLAADELAKADRYRVQRAHDQYVVARAALRRILGACLEADPAALRFDYGPQGKPALAPPWDGQGLAFNLSHSGEWALAALTRGRPIGVDVEHMRPKREEEKLARRFFSPAEQSALFALPEADRAEAFHACWTCKEAYLKARGDGLTFPLDAFDVALPPAPPGLLDVRGEPGNAGAWQINRFQVAPHYPAACAIRGGGIALEYFHYALLL